MKTANPKAEAAPIDVASQAVAVREEQSLAVAGQLSEQDIGTLVSVGAIPAETPPAVITFFAKACSEMRLSPFKRQVYLIKRNTKNGPRYTMQTGIDGFRTIADRSKAYAGNDDPKFDEGLNEYQMIADRRQGPTTATVTVYKAVGGLRCPFTATAKWEEYCPPQGQTHMWDKMPFLMLSKCAEALALRKAFPDELSGLHTDEEMGQATSDEPLRDLDSRDSGGYLPKESEASGATHSAETLGKRAPTQAGGQPSASEPRAQSTPVPQTSAGNPTAKAATAVTRQRMIKRLFAEPGGSARDMVTDYFHKCEGWLLPTENIEDLPLRFVPATVEQLKLLEAAIADFGDGHEARKPYNANPDPEDLPKTRSGKPGWVQTPSASSKPALPPKAQGTVGRAVEVPRDDAWRQFPLPRGPRKGTLLGQLAENKKDQAYLWGWWKNRTALAEPTFEGREGNTVKKSGGAIKEDLAFLKALESAGASLGFTEE